MDTFEMKRGDLLPELERTLTDGDGNAITIPGGATVSFKLRKRGAGSLKVNAAATVVDAATGRVKYTWTGTNTDTAGVYRGEFQVTSATKPTTFPNNGYIVIRIREDLD